MIMRRFPLTTYFNVSALVFLNSSVVMEGQGTCPDNTLSSVTCNEVRLCPRDYVCITGLCCPSCRRKAEESNALPNVYGIYIPQCDISGSYTPEQCSTSTGVCWCVTEIGQEIPRTRITAGTPRKLRCADERLRYSGFSRTAPSMPGQCPTSTGFGPCVNNCNTDADCIPTNQKCCPNGCGKQCMLPVNLNSNLGSDEKIGTCPKNINGAINQNYGDECQNDKQCLGVQICCQTSFGKKCQTPENTDSLAQVQANQVQQVQPVQQLPQIQQQLQPVQPLPQPQLQPVQQLSQPQPVQPAQQFQQIQCNGINEEFQSCGEACPKSCDTLNQAIPNYCNSAGCSSGCFCKQGFIRRTSRDPRSDCLLSVQCQPAVAASLSAQPVIAGGGVQSVIAGGGAQPLTAGAAPSPVIAGAGILPISNAVASTNNVVQQSNGLQPGIGTAAVLQPNSAQNNAQFQVQDQFSAKPGTCPVGQLHPAVAQSLTTAQAIPCSSDSSCMGTQKCCSPPPQYASIPLRCLCPDPNAYWKDCGYDCQETCQSNNQIRTNQCSPCCVCVDGYVKQSNAPNAQCIPRNQCQYIAGSQFGGQSTVTAATPQFTRATVKLTNSVNIEGVLYFEQNGNNVLITGTIRGLQPGLHAIHIHSSGDISNGCNLLGSHFDPDHQDHGAPGSARHLGDLGNVVTDQNGFSYFNLNDNRISLNGPNTVIGRSLAIHENQDDLGQGVGIDSKRTGNSGQPLVCGTIGVIPQ